MIELLPACEKPSGSNMGPIGFPEHEPDPPVAGRQPYQLPSAHTKLDFFKSSALFFAPYFLFGVGICGSLGPPIRSKRSPRAVVAKSDTVSLVRSFVFVSAIRRVSRTESGLMSVQPPLNTADIVSFRVCHPQPNRRRSGIFDFRDEFLAQPAKRKSVRACRRKSCVVKATYYDMVPVAST
jgi:hypothetical protein